MHYVVSLSGGTASAVAAERAIRRYGRERVTLWFADTSWEDEDLYRFLNDLMARWGGELLRHTDGRTPLQVAAQEMIIPNQRRAPCSRDLKIKPFVAWLKAQPKPITVLLGLDWKEQHRMKAPKENYEAIEGVSVDFPLMWRPYEAQSYHEIVRSWGIAVPRLYGLGFPHNNCGGRCVKQGLKQWLLLRKHFPERFAEVRDWEQAQRAKGGPRADYAIARDQSGYTVTPLPLADLERRIQPEEIQPGDDAPTQEDMFGCFCSY